MTNKELMLLFKQLQLVKSWEWLRFIKTDEENLPYQLAEEAEKLDGAVRTLCPPGYEVDR